MSSSPRAWAENLEIFPVGLTQRIKISGKDVSRDEVHAGFKLNCPIKKTGQSAPEPNKSKSK